MTDCRARTPEPDGWDARAYSGDEEEQLGHDAITLAAGSIVFAGNNGARPGIAMAKIFPAFAVLYGVLFCALQD